MLFRNAVLYAQPTVNDLALKLQLIYKDELFKKQLVMEGEIYLNKFNNNIASQQFAEIISQ